MAKKIKVGDTIYGYAGGYFGRDSYDDKIVIKKGKWSSTKWIILANISYPNRLYFLSGDDVDAIVEYTTPEPVWD